MKLRRIETAQWVERENRKQRDWNISGYDRDIEHKYRPKSVMMPSDQVIRLNLPPSVSQAKILHIHRKQEVQRAIKSKSQRLKRQKVYLRNN
jgi:hypothetical protein